MPVNPKQSRLLVLPSLREDVCRQVPHVALVLCLIGAWIVLFQFFGNSTLGYVNTPSLFGWWVWTMNRTPDEELAWFIPLVVAVLLWWRRDELLALRKRIWWPAFGIFVLALLMHVLGYMIQQGRISVVAFFLGIYGLTGLMWGRGWMSAALFPFSLFVFCVPLGSGGTEIVTLPLRLLATDITAVVCRALLGIDVVQNGNLLFDAAGTYQYEVAAACSGIRSLTAILAFGVIYGYITFKTTWRRLVMVAAAFPLAVVANVFRLTLIVLSAEAFGQKAGNYVHENSWFSLAPYVPAIGGMLLLGWWLREDRKPRKAEEPMVIAGAEQKL